jgi:hypothetical protein
MAPISFVSASSCPVNVLGPSCKAVSELLLVLSLCLNRDFHANLASELNLPRGFFTEPDAKELHIVLIGGSHMHYTAPHLASLGAKITNLSVPGWISNVASGQLLIDRVCVSELPPDAIFVFDVLGNSSARFEQADDSSSLPVKLRGSHHLLGNLKMMEGSHIEQALSPVSHLFKNILKSKQKIFIPPIPRFVCGSCCKELDHGPNIRSSGHGERMLGEHCRIRNTLKESLIRGGVQNMRVLDTLGSITGKNTLPSQLDSLKLITARDNVHLTGGGYLSLAQGILSEAQKFGETKVKGKHSLSGKQPTHQVEWHGFVSPGLGKLSLKAGKRFLGVRSHPYNKGK